MSRSPSRPRSCTGSSRRSRPTVEPSDRLRAVPMSDFQVSPELLSIYIEDARAHLEALDHCLLGLERDGFDAEAVSAVLGPLHTLKGNSGMMGFTAIKDYVHGLEDVFARIRAGALNLSPTLFDRLFAGATTRSHMVRVDFGQLDHLLNLVGELIIFRTKLHGMGRDMAEQLGDRAGGRDLLEAVHQVAAVSTQLQETVMDIRMLP